MKDLYTLVGISKQAFWKFQNREDSNFTKAQKVIKIIQRIRRRHKRMGCRSIYFASKDKPPVGRDAFIQIGYANGFKLKRSRNKRKTTWSQQVEIFPNLIEGKALTSKNQVWQSDIFYYHENGKDYYGITIIDVYTKMLLALHISTSLRAEENVKAFHQALQTRSGQDLTDCIFHSDRGSQYISNGFKYLLREYKM